MSINNSDELFLVNALDEDVGSGDITTAAVIAASQKGTARIITKQAGILAGSDLSDRVFKLKNKQMLIKWDRRDGDRLRAGETVAVIEGFLKDILEAERLALNLLGHLSGIASMTAQYVKRVKGTRAKIIDTRKTIPLMRTYQKEAVRVGGGYNHRMGLYDMVLLKENHIATAGGIKQAVERVQKYLSENEITTEIEVETRNIEEVHEALASDVNRIMLDNMTIEEMKEAVDIINKQVEVEASGGVTLETVADIAATGVDFISVGGLTHSVTVLDFSMLVDRI